MTDKVDTGEEFPQGTPVVLRGARSWHGVVVRYVPHQGDVLGTGPVPGYVIDFGGGEQIGFAAEELMIDPTAPHEYAEGQTYGPGRCAFSGCAAPADDEVHDARRVEIERQRREHDAQTKES